MGMLKGKPAKSAGVIWYGDFLLKMPAGVLLQIHHLSGDKFSNFFSICDGCSAYIIRDAKKQIKKIPFP